MNYVVVLLIPDVIKECFLGYIDATGDTTGEHLTDLIIEFIERSGPVFSYTLR